MALVTTTDADFAALAAKVDSLTKNLNAVLQDLDKFTSMLMAIQQSTAVPNPTAAARGNPPKAGKG